MMEINLFIFGNKQQLTGDEMKVLSTEAPYVLINLLNIKRNFGMKL